MYRLNPVVSSFIRCFSQGPASAPHPKIDAKALQHISNTIKSSAMFTDFLEKGQYMSFKEFQTTYTREDKKAVTLQKMQDAYTTYIAARFQTYKQAAASSKANPAHII